MTLGKETEKTRIKMILEWVSSNPQCLPRVGLQVKMPKLQSIYKVANSEGRPLTHNPGVNTLTIRYPVLNNCINTGAGSQSKIWKQNIYFRGENKITDKKIKWH